MAPLPDHSRLTPPTVAVGTALAGGPPHGSQRAELPHWAPASGIDVEASFGVGMQDMGRWEPLRRQATHALPGEAMALAAPPERRTPETHHLQPESAYRSAVAGHCVVAQVPAHHAAKPAPLCGRMVQCRRRSS